MHSLFFSHARTESQIYINDTYTNKIAVYKIYMLPSRLEVVCMNLSGNNIWPVEKNKARLILCYCVILYHLVTHTLYKCT